MTTPEQPAAKSDFAVKIRLQQSSAVFVLATKIGFFALLYFVILLFTLMFTNVPRVFWTIGFLFSLLTLLGHFAGWLNLAYHSGGYGVSGSFLQWEYCFLALSSTVSGSMAFSGRLRYVVVILLAAFVWLSAQLIPALWTVLARDVVRWLRPVR